MNSKLKEVAAEIAECITVQNNHFKPLTIAEQEIFAKGYCKALIIRDEIDPVDENDIIKAAIKIATSPGIDI